jgi:hypothetical protein
VARFYDPAIAHFVQVDSLIPSTGTLKGYDRCAYVDNCPINRSDPTGHCGYLNLFNPVGSFINCYNDIKKTISLYNSRVTNPYKLISAAVGLTNLVEKVYKEIDSLNHDTAIAFSRNGSNQERLLASVHVGLFAVSTAANIVGGASGKGNSCIYKTRSCYRS